MKKRIKLKDIASYSKGLQINGEDLISDGLYDYINGGVNPSGKWNEANCTANTITISEGGNSCGYVNFMPKPFWCGAHCYYLYDTIDNSQYLYYALKSQQERIMRLRSGACMPNIKKNDLGNFEFTFDSDINEQEKIVSVLSKVKTLISKQNQQLVKLDELVKSRFIELFGDPESNPKGWDRQRFDQICENLDSRRVPITSTDRKAGNYPYYGASGIVDYVEDYIFDEDILLISEDGANLLMRSTPIAFSVSGKVWVNNHAHVVRFESKATQKYIEVCFALTDISGSITGTAQPKLNQAKLNAMLFCIPPLELQNQFAAFVEQVDKSKLVALKYINVKNPKSDKNRRIRNEL